MGFVGQLKFAILCIDFLAWPVIALGYPLFASIRAIETGSKYHTRKLVIYWTLFSLISLFEYAFVKIIEWVPFWSVMKLIAIIWLAIPRFHGACYAYISFVRPLLVANLPELISRFEEQRRANKETFVDEADKYIKENEFEKLVATERNCEEANSCHRDTQHIESNDEATSKQLKKSVAALKDNEMSGASTEVVKQVLPVTTSNLVTKETTYAAAVTKGILGTSPKQTIPEIKKPAATPVTPPPNKWTCSLCRVTTTCENNLNDHLRGKNHKAMVESLKSSKLNASGTGPEKSAGPDRGGVSDVELVGSASLSSHLNGKRHAPNVMNNWTCSLCRVTTTCKNNLNDHLRGKNHKAMVESLKSSKLDAPGTGPGKYAGLDRGGVTRHWCFACDVELVGSASLASHLNGKRHAANVTNN